MLFIGYFLGVFYFLALPACFPAFCSQHSRQSDPLKTQVSCISEKGIGGNIEGEHNTQKAKIQVRSCHSFHGFLFHSEQKFNGSILLNPSTISIPISLLLFPCFSLVLLFRSQACFCLRTFIFCFFHRSAFSSSIHMAVFLYTAPTLLFTMLLYFLFSITLQFSSVQFSRSVVSDSLQPHELQHARPPCPSPTPGVHSDSRPSSQ